jgi:hypothetical protein
MFAIFEATYPGRDWGKCTLFGFLDRCEMAPYVMAMLHGRYTFEMQADMKGSEIVEELEIKRRFRLCFPAGSWDDDD